MVAPRRIVFLVVCLAVLGITSSFAFAQDADADQARVLLGKGIKFFDATHYLAAKSMLLQAADKKALSGADKTKLDSYLAKVDPAIRGQRSAMQSQAIGEKALKAGNLDLANTAFAKVATSKYVTKQVAANARRQLTVVSAKKNAAKKASLAARQANRPSVKASARKMSAAKPAANKMLSAAASRRKVHAQSLIAEGKKHLKADDPKEALIYFKRAQAVQPDNRQVPALIAIATKQSNTTKTLRSLQMKLKIQREEAIVDIERQLGNASRILHKPADSSAEFNNAEESVAVGRNTLESRRSSFSSAGYDTWKRRIDSKDAEVAALADAWDRKQVERTRTRVRDAKEAFITRSKVQRAKRIADLIERAKALEADRKYKEVIPVLEEILILDQDNEYAIGRKTLVADLWYYKRVRASRIEGEEGTREALLSIKDAGNQIDKELLLPKDWAELTKRRSKLDAGDHDDSEENRMIAKKLAAPVSPEFEEQELKDVFEFLRAMSGANMHVNWNALGLEGIEPTTSVTVKLANVSLRKALRVVLDDVSGGGESNGLDFLVDSGVITISTKVDLERSVKPIQKIYDIRDLLVRNYDFKAPSMKLGTVSTGGSQGLETDDDDDDDDGMSRKGMRQAIINLLLKTVAPNSWADNGGTIGSIDVLSGQLVIKQTLENHQEIGKLLSRLREATKLQVSVEARFIAVESSFLYRVGVDLDLYFNLGSTLGNAPAGVQLPGGAWAGHSGNNRITPLGVVQNGTGSGLSPFTNNIFTGVGTDIGAAIGTPAFAIAGSFLDDIQVDFLIEATEAHHSSRTLTAPRITLLNGQRAYITVATQQTYISGYDAQTSDNAVAYTPVVSTVPTGSVLDVEATVSADRRFVTMAIRPRVTKLEDLSPTDIGGLSQLLPIQLPTVTEERLETMVVVPDGGTLLLGGQKWSGEIVRELGTPLLSKVPILKRLWTNNGQTLDEKTLLILVKPKIIVSAEEEQKQFPGMDE